MAVVVRCTGCGGLARVGPEAVGLLVVCPRCGDPFLADAVPESSFAPAPPAPPAPPPRPAARAEPVAPPRPPRPRRRPPEPAPEPHDHPPPADGVPFSVIIGLALLPLTIPLLWLIGPAAVGHPPALTVATPVALAVSAAVLCLAVAYTVDWSPVTRIKGVVTLVGLAYFAGLSLYFLKRDTAEWAREKLGAPAEWHVFTPPGREYEVRLPGQPKPVLDDPVPGLKPAYYRATLTTLVGVEVYTVGVGPDPDPAAADADWFRAVGASLRGPGGAAPPPGKAAAGGAARLPGREWQTPPPPGAAARLVRVYRDRAAGRAYVLTAEGAGLTADDDDVARFFGSFTVPAGKE